MRIANLFLVSSYGFKSGHYWHIKTLKIVIGQSLKTILWFCLRHVNFDFIFRPYFPLDFYEILRQSKATPMFSYSICK
jgi:hypothetical protein